MRPNFFNICFFLSRSPLSIDFIQFLLIQSKIILDECFSLFCKSTTVFTLYISLYKALKSCDLSKLLIFIRFSSTVHIAHLLSLNISCFNTIIVQQNIKFYILINTDNSNLTLTLFTIIMIIYQQKNASK